MQDLTDNPHQMISVLCYHNNIFMVLSLDSLAFEKHVAFQMTQGTMNTFGEFKSMFTLTLTYITSNWFLPIMNAIHDMHTPKEKII